VRENIEIDGIVYYIDALSGYSYSDAKTICKSQNMTLIRFETEEKWYSINRWLRNSVGKYAFDGDF